MPTRAAPPEQQLVDDILLEPMPMHGPATVEELGGIVEFLARDAARNVTGQWIVVYGGWTAEWRMMRSGQ